MSWYGENAGKRKHGVSSRTTGTVCRAVRIVGRTRRGNSEVDDNRSRRSKSIIVFEKHDDSREREYKTETRITDDGALARVHDTHECFAGILERRIGDTRSEEEEEEEEEGTALMSYCYYRVAVDVVGTTANNQSDGGNRVKLASARKACDGVTACTTQ